MPTTPAPKTIAEAVRYIEAAIKAQAVMVANAKKADPAFQESDFNRGYTACLIDTKAILTKGEP